MRNRGCVYLFLILCLLGFIICAGCTQKDGANPLLTMTPGVPVAPGQSDPGAPAGTCPEPQIWCNGRCIDPATDMGNCGGCMNPCQPGQPCIGGKCGSEVPAVPGTPGTPGIPEIPGTPGIPGTSAVTGTPITSGTPGTLSCGSAQTNCYGTCADLQSDATHCGACNIKCASGKVCSAGSCTISCSAGQNNCGGSCTNTQTSSQHCGKCNNPCSSGQTCQNGKCGLYASVMTLDPHDICINSGKSWCWGTCADIQTDSSHCGSCGHACGVGEPCSKAKCLSWTGKWNSWSALTSMTLVQTGTSVSGTNPGIEYVAMGTMSGTTSGNPPKLTGTWNNPQTTQSGTFEMTMSSDGKKFNGLTYYKGGTDVVLIGDR